MLQMLSNGKYIEDVNRKQIKTNKKCLCFYQYLSMSVLSVHPPMCPDFMDTLYIYIYSMQYVVHAYIYIYIYM